MIPAFLTTLLWSYCAIATHRSVAQLGENLANLARIVVAVICLGIIAYLFGLGHGGGGFVYFFLSGVIGFGIGDIGIFYALRRLGTRLTILMAQCLAAPIAGIGEWFWLKTTIGLGSIVSIGIILAGIMVALMPKHMPVKGWRNFTIGIGFGLIAAFGQGMGAVLSRGAYMQPEWPEAAGLGESLALGATAGYQRLLGGVVVIALFYLICQTRAQWRSKPDPEKSKDSGIKKIQFVLLTALSGPVIGIICFQWALSTTPSAIVQPIVALTPLLVIPMALYWEGDRPNSRSIVGGVISVVGVILLAIYY